MSQEYKNVFEFKDFAIYRRQLLEKLVQHLVGNENSENIEHHYVRDFSCQASWY